MKILLLLLPLLLFGDLTKNFYKYDTSFKEISKEIGVPFILLKAIALTENNSYKGTAQRENTNGTKDYGLMQINTIWLKTFDISEEKIMIPKENIKVAARILKKLIKSYGYNWESIGRYHSATPKYKKIWLSKIKNNIKLIIKNDKRNNYIIEA